MKKIVKAGVIVAGVAAVGYLAYKGVKKLMEKAALADMCCCCGDEHECHCGGECKCHEEQAACPECGCADEAKVGCNCDCHDEDVEVEIVVEEQTATAEAEDAGEPAPVEE